MANSKRFSAKGGNVEMLNAKIEQLIYVAQNTLDTKTSFRHKDMFLDRKTKRTYIIRQKNKRTYFQI